MLTECFFGAGLTLDAITNVETVIDAPQVLDLGRIPLAGPVKTRLMDGSSRRDGKINVPLKFDIPADAGRIALNTFLFGNQTTQSALMYLATLDEFGFYSPFLVNVDRPYEQVDYSQAVGGTYVQALILPCFDWRLQVLTKTGDYTVTAGDHYLKGDTSGGNITFALPPLADVNENVVYSFHKIASAHNLVLDGDGSETIDGATTKTLTANGARIDIAKRGGLWRTVKLGLVA